MTGLRALLVSHTGEPGGSNTVLLDLIRHAPADVEPACVFLDEGPAHAAALSLGAPSQVVPSGQARQAWRLPGVVGRLRAAMRAHRADLVFAHVPKAHLYASPAASLEKIPYIWWQHELPGYKRRQHWVAERLPAAAVICSSRFTADLQRERRPGTPVHCVYPGIELTDEEPHRHERTNDILVGSVARLQRWKRIELLLRAVPHVLQEAPGTRFEVIGGEPVGFDEDYPPSLRSLVSELGIEQAVEFTGHVDAVSGRIRDLDVMAHTAHLEPFGIAVLEAMALEVPVVASAVGGPAEILRDGVDGVFADVEDERALAAAILNLARDPVYRRALGSSARGRVAERFTVERMAREAWALAETVAI